MSENTNPDEIDLVHLIIKIGVIIKNNLLLIVSFFVIGILSGCLWYSQQKKVYESKMIVSSEVVAETYSLIENLNELLNENSYDIFAQKLKISLAEAKKINGIKIEKVEIKRDELSEKEKEKVYLAISVRVYDQKVLSTLQKQMINHFSNNEFSKIKMSQRMRAAKKMIEKITEEITTLEEFKNRIYKGNFFASTKGNVMFDPTEVNAKILSLTKEKMDYEDKLILADAVQVVSGFVPFDKPASPKWNLMLFVSAFIGLFFASIVIAFKEFIKIIKLEKSARTN